MKKQKIIRILILIAILFVNTIVYGENTESTTQTVKQTKVNPALYGEEGHVTITNVNGNFYKDYKQGNYQSMGVTSKYSQICPSKSSDIFAYVGAGPTATAVVLSAYGVTGTTGKNALPYVIGELVEVYERRNKCK